ncbi:MAG: hypothetical protein ACO1RX_20150 [Candidatus Sericytochromatia bacterium]
MHSARAKDGSAVAVKQTDRIVSIADEPVEHYLVDVVPQPVGTARPNLIRAEKVVIEPLTFAGGVVSAGPQKTFWAQVHYEKAKQHSSKRNPDGPETKGSLIVLTADQKKVSKLLELVFADSLEGKAFANTYAFARVTETVTDADPDGGDPGTRIPHAESIPYREIDLTTQYSDDGPNAAVIGDVRIVVDREFVSQEQLEASDYFTLTPQGGNPSKYTLWNEDGIRSLRTHHYAIYLQRMKGV